MVPKRNGPREAEPPEQVLYLESGAAVGQAVRLEGSEADHARRSLRLRPGNPVFLVDGRGHRYTGQVTGLGRRHLEIEVSGVMALPVWPDRPVLLGAGVLRSTRMDVIVEKASELGVCRFTPLVLDRSVARPGGEGARAERWQRLAIESLKQSRRSRLMEVAPPVSLEAFLETLPPERTLWAAHPGGISPIRAASAPGTGPVALVIGPEGGLSEPELERLRAAGAILVHLGGHRLRAETASLALLVASLTVLGQLEPEV